MSNTYDAVTPATTQAPTTAPPSSVVEASAAVSSGRGWWGVGFVLLLLVSEAAVTLPASTHTAAYIQDFYGRYRWPVVVTQLGELLATWFLWRFVRGLVHAIGATTSSRSVLIGGALLCAGSLLTAAPVLALAAGMGSAEPTILLLAAWTDYSDLVMAGAIALFGVACARTALPTWARFGGVAVSVVSLARVALALLGSGALDNIAPILFLAFVLALNVHLIVRSARQRRVRA